MAQSTASTEASAFECYAFAVTIGGTRGAIFPFAVGTTALKWVGKRLLRLAPYLIKKSGIGSDPAARLAFSKLYETMPSQVQN